MLSTSKTAQEFIQSSFSPVLAVLCGSKVDGIVSKNNLSFVELLQPFTNLDWEGHLRDPAGTQCTVKNWKLVVRDVNWKPPPPTEARKQLNNAVIVNYSDGTVPFEIGVHKFEIPLSTPWFDAWREAYFEVQFPSDHEFTKHFLGCLLVATTSDENVTETFSNLLQHLTVLQNITPPKLPKWFSNNILKTYVLLHDTSIESREKADTLFDQVKQIYGANNCLLLCINSKSSGEPDGEHVSLDPWAPYINHMYDVHNEPASGHNSLPRTPVDARTVSSLPTNVTTTAQEETTIVVQPEGLHPLSPIEDTEAYDNANSLQNNTFSGSTESVSMNTNMSESFTASPMALHGTALNKNDIEAIKQFLRDYATKALLPHFEKQISQMNEVVANRKGVSRSLLSATKRWFGSNKPGTNTNINTVIYSGECPELQLRRLGDLWFMCGQWQRAFDAYHTAKREFSADGAWLCYAGALEMAALSAFMAGEPSRKTYGYMEESILTYLNTCRMVQYAVRATLLSVLCLSSGGLHGEAAKQLIRMTSEDSDLRSAMLLEQAALCFLAGPATRVMRRKYAFHMVLAGHRFSKASQKKHAYRCYKHAYQVYANSGWRLAADHVQFALGRLATALKLTSEAVAWLAAPLTPLSPQPAPQQLALLREYMQAHTQWVENSEEFKKVLPPLALPLIESNATAVLCVGMAPLSSPGRTPATSITLHEAEAAVPLPDKHWHKMEEMLVQVAQGSVPMIFKPTVNLHMNTTENTTNPIVPQGEPVQISILVYNPLKISLTLKDVELLWQFKRFDESNEIFSNEPAIASGTPLDCNIVSCQKIKSLILDGDTKKFLYFSITPLHVGELQLLGLAYKLTSTKTYEDPGNGNTISGKQSLEIILNKQSKSQNLTDKRLQINVTPCAPCLQMTFSDLNSNLLSGEIQKVDVEFRNVGPMEMKNLHIAVSHPESLCLVTSESDFSSEEFGHLYDVKYKPLPSNLEERTMRMTIWRTTCSRHVRLVSSSLAGGGCVRASLLLRPTSRTRPLRLLAYYEAGMPPYRLLRHTFTFNVVDSIQIVAVPRRNIKLNSNSQLAAETINLATEIKNVASAKDVDIRIDILETSLLSRQWRFTDSVKALRCNNTLCVHEKLHLVLRGSRVKKLLSEKNIEWSSLKISKVHAESQPNVNVTPYSKFIVDYPSPFEDEADTFTQDDARTKHGLIQSMLVVRWKAQIQFGDSNRNAIGQHYIWLECFNTQPFTKGIINVTDIPTLKFGQENIMDTYNASDDDYKGGTVMFKLEHSQNVDHNFKTRKLCLVPVIIHIVNCYGVPVKACIEMSKRETSNIGWVGALCSSAQCGVAVSLGPYEARRVPVSAVCAAPGTYLLGPDFMIATYIRNKPTPLLQNTVNTSLLIVNQIK